MPSIKTTALRLGLVVLACSAHASLMAASLENLRDAEVQTLSLCPEKPSIAVVGGAGAGLLLIDLLETGSFELVERQALSSINAEICVGAEFDPASVAAGGNLVFAMYLVEVNFNPADDLPIPISTRAIRVDSGMEIYSRSGSIGEGGLEELHDFLDELTSALQAAVAANEYECKNRFTGIFEEQLALHCQDNYGPAASNYEIKANPRVVFTVDDIDFENRDAVQNLTGTATLKPSAAQTLLTDRIEQSTRNCTAVLEATRTIDIQLEENEIPASFELRIPQDAKGAWQFRPVITHTRPLFIGPANMRRELITTPLSDCTGPGGTHIGDTAYRHLEANNFIFVTHKLYPLCHAEDSIDPAMTRTPNFGVPTLVEIGPQCATRTATVKNAFKRKF